MWFHKTIPHARCIMVEPDLVNLQHGRRNFAINGMSGTFVHAGVGKGSEGRNGEQTIAVDDVIREYAIDRLGILHSDVQGFELDMLVGAEGVTNSAHAYLCPSLP